jgi:hypothetical protein
MVIMQMNFLNKTKINIYNIFGNNFFILEIEENMVYKYEWARPIISD